MAMNWIKVGHATPDKPEVVQLAYILEIDQDAAFGKCVRLWIWADQQSVDGNALSVTHSFLDRLVFCNGFAKALVKVGWLDGRDGRLSIPNFDRHNGQSAKKRAQTTKRVANHRNASSVTEALPDKIRGREEDIHTPTHTCDADWKSHKEVRDEWRTLWESWIDSWEGRMGKRFDPALAQHQLFDLCSKSPTKAAADLKFSLDHYAKSILNSDNDFSKQKSSGRGGKPKKEPVRL